MAGNSRLRAFPYAGSLTVISLAIKAVVSLIIAVALLRCLKGVSVSSFVSFLSRPRTRSVIANSFLIGFASAFFSTLTGVFLAAVLDGCDFAMRRPLMAIVRIPFALPSLVIIIAMASVFGVSGIFSSFHRLLYGPAGVILAHVYYDFPLAFANASSALGQRSLDAEESFRTLGAGRAKAFLLITLPSIFKTLGLSFILIFFSAFSSFTIVMTFGGMGFSNIESEIYKSFTAGDGQGYAALCLLSVAGSTVFTAISAAVQKLVGYGAKGLVGRRSRGTFRRRLFANGLSVLICAATVIPLLSIVASAFFGKDGFALENFGRLSGMMSAIARSVCFSFIASFVCVMAVIILCACSKRDRSGNLIVLFAGSLSSIVLSSSFANTPLLSLFLAHVLMSMPFSYYLIKGEYDAMSSSLIGNSDLSCPSAFARAFYAEASNLKRSIPNALAFSFSMSLCDATATLVLARGRFYTVSLLLYQAVSRYDFSSASAICVMIAVLAALQYAISTAVIKAVFRP